jgi:prolyl-tRNA synthetase
LTALQEKTNWEKTNRWDDKIVDNWFKTELKNGTTLGLGFTHEEAITALMKNHIRSFRDMPVSAYQFQTKFRNEARAKSGIMRGREFLMKDLYSFCLDKEQHETYYEQAKQAYVNIFDRVGLGQDTYITFASGGSFSKYSHEFQTVSEAGEDIIYACDKCKLAVNKEVIAEQDTCPVCGDKNLIEKKAIEVGNIFTLGEKFSEALELNYLNDKGEKKNVFMGCYGIGPARVMGTIVENLSDNKRFILFCHKRSSCFSGLTRCAHFCFLSAVF